MNLRTSKKNVSFFRSAIIASAVKCCGQKRLRVAREAKKECPGETRMLKKQFELCIQGIVT